MQVKRAVTALVNHLHKQEAGGKTPLLADNKSPIYVRVTLKRIPGRAVGRPVQM